MKINVGKLLPLYDILNEISDKKMQVSTAYKINKDVKLCHDELKNINESSIKLAENYCIRDKDNKPILKDNIYQFEDKDLPIINEELNKLNQVELDLPLITIKLSELDNLELSPIDIEKISIIMEE